MLPEVPTPLPLLTSPTIHCKTSTHFKSKRKHIRRASSTHRKPPWISSATCFCSEITEWNCRSSESVCVRRVTDWGDGYILAHAADTVTFVFMLLHSLLLSTEVWSPPRGAASVFVCVRLWCCIHCGEQMWTQTVKPATFLKLWWPTQIPRGQA